MSAIKVDWLPLGSIVLLQGENIPRMIVARFVSDGKSAPYDYAGCVYPVGDLDGRHRRYFNGDEIESVAFFGYKDAAEVDFENKMTELLKSQKNGVNQHPDTK